MGATQAFQLHPFPLPSSSSSSSSIGEASSGSSDGTSSSSSDLLFDASSTLNLFPDSSSSSLACKSNKVFRDGRGSFCELSDLMTHLPIKRGLSMHYSGKSQSFTSMVSVKSVEDLAKKENPCAKRLKLCAGRGFEGRSSPDILGQAAAAAAMPRRKRPSSYLATSISNRPPIPIVRTF